MNDLDQDRNALLSKFSNKLKEQAAAQVPQVPPAPQDNQVVSNQVAEPVVVPTAAQVTKEEPKPAEPVAQAAPVPPIDPAKELSTEPAPVVEEIPEAWDKELTPPKVDSKPFTIESLGSALKLSDVKTTEDVVAKFTGLETKVKELEAARDTVLEDLPDDLKEVVKVAKSKGDWKAYLGTTVVDYSKVDPVKLFENSIEQQARFRKPDGTIDFDAVDEALAAVPLVVREAQGETLKQQLMNNQTARRNQLYQETQRRQFEYNSKLADATKNIGTLLSKDKVGITLEPKHSDFLYEGIRSGKLVEKHLGKIDVSGIAPDKLAKTLALAEWGESIAKHNRDQGIVQGKKQLLTQSQNVQLRTPASPPTPNAPDQKPESPAEKMAKRVAQFTKPGSL